MLGLWLEEGAVEVRDDLPLPDPGPDEALVSVRLAGICGTDLALLRGYTPFAGIPGHEFVGEVVAGPAALVGSRVCGDINVVCGVCDACAAGQRHHCHDRRVLGLRGWNGAFAEHLLLPTVNLEPVPETLRDAVAVFAEPLAAALAATREVAEVRADDVLVVGDGRLGQLVARALIAEGARVVMLGKHARKLELASEIGVDACLKLDAEARFPAVVECSGSPSGLERAVAATRARGTVVLKSTYPSTAAHDVSRIVVNEIRLVGSRCGSIALALETLARGAVCTEDLVDEELPLREGTEALRRAGRPGALKVLLDTRGA